MEDSKERLDRLENRIKANFFEIEKRLAKIEGSGDKNIEQRVHELEDLVLMLETDSTKLKDKLSEKREEKGKDYKKIEESFSKKEKEFEERLGDLEKLIVSEKDMKKQPKGDINKKIADLESKIGKAGYEKLEKKLGELEKKISSTHVKEIESRLGNLEKSYTQEIEKMEHEIEKTGKVIVKEEMNHYLDKILERVEMLKKEFEGILKEKEEGTADLDSKDMEIVDSLEDRIELLEDKFLSIRTSSGKEIAGSDIEKRISSLEGILGAMRTEKATLPKDVEEIMERLGDMEDYISKGKMPEGTAKSDVDKKLEKKLEERLEEIEKKLSTIKTKEAVKIELPESLEEKLNKIEKRLESKHESHENTEKIEKKLEELEEKIASGGSQKFAPTSNKDIALLRKRTDDLEEIVKSIDLRQFEGAVRDESVQRANLANAFKVLEDRMTILEGLKTKEGEINFDMLITEFQKIKNSVLDLERSFENKATKFITKNLEEFAKSMDKRMPNLITKKEFENLMAEMEQLRKISPSHLERRVEILEKKIDSIANSMKIVYNRMPMIVE